MLIVFQYQLSSFLRLRSGQILKGFFTGAVRCYQMFISPLKQSSCRFYPTCSSYSIQAFERYGVLRGVYLTLKRLFKCHPFHQGGYDPLP